MLDFTWIDRTHDCEINWMGSQHLIFVQSRSSYERGYPS